MLERQLGRCFLIFVVLTLACEQGLAAGHRRPAGSDQISQRAHSEPVVEESDSNVEYVNDGPLGALYDFLIQNNLLKLCNLLRKSNIQNYLVDSGPWTIFAPSDGSFAFLPGGTLDEFEKNEQMMVDFLLHHFVTGDLASTQILDEMVVDTIQGTPVRFNIYGPPDVITVSGAEIMQPDLQFEFGRVHIIDRPLYPYSNYDLLGYLQTYHSEMYKLIINAGLAEFLSGGTFTIFAPDDKAFEFISTDLKDALATNESLAQGVVLTHVLPASMFVRGLANGAQLNSVGNADLLFTQRRGLTFVNGVPILTPDVPVSNGVVHVVNRLLLPEGITADCQCRPFDYNRGNQASQSRFPYEPSRITTTTEKPVSVSRPQTPGRPSGFSTSGRLPGFQTNFQDHRQISTGFNRESQTSGSISGRRPVAPLVQQPQTTTPPRTVQTVTPMPAKRVPFNPNRIPSSRATPGPSVPRTQRPWNPAGDTLLTELNENDDFVPTAPPAVVAITQRIRSTPAPTVRPQRVQQVVRQPVRQPVRIQATRRPIQQTIHTGFPSPPPFEDNTLDVLPGPTTENQPITDISEFEISSQRGKPHQQGHFQTSSGGHRQHIQIQQQRPGQSQVQPIQTPGQTLQQSTQRQPTQRPGRPVQIQPTHRPSRPIQIQPTQRPARPTQIQPTQRPGQPIQRPGQTVQNQPIQRPGQSVQTQPVQRPGQPIQIPTIRPVQPSRVQTGQQPSFQPIERPIQTPGAQTIAPIPASPAGRTPTPSTRRTPSPVLSPTVRPPIQARPGYSQQISGRQQLTPTRTTSLFPTRRPGQQDHSTKGQTYNPQRQRRPPGRIPPAPPAIALLPPSSNSPVLVPISGPGLDRPPFELRGEMAACRQRHERVTLATQSLPLCPPFADLEPCQRLDELYNPTDPRPPCEGIDVPIDCKPPGLPIDFNDPRPECPEIELLECRMPDEATFLGDRRPLCDIPGNNEFPAAIPVPQQRPVTRGPAPPTGRRQTFTGAITNQDQGRQTSSDDTPTSNCRQVFERPIPGDRRPLCRISQMNPTIAPTTTLPFVSELVTTQSSCRPLNERPSIGDRRPVCSFTAGGTRQQVNQPIRPVQQPSGQRPSQPQISGRRPIQPASVQVQGPGSQQRPARPSFGQPQRTTLPSTEENEIITESPDLLPITDEPIAQPGTRPPSPVQFTTRRPPVQPVRGQPARGQFATTTRRPSIQTQAPRIPSQHTPINRQQITTTRSPIRPNELERQPVRPTVRPAPVGQRPGASPVAVSGPSTAAAGPRTLYEIVSEPALLIQGRPVKLTKIFELFQKAGLEYIFSDPGPYTVFLPSDDAFLRLPKGVIEQLEADPFLLQQVLLFHVTTSDVLPGQGDESYAVPSVQGTPILITMLKGGRMILISGAKAVAVTKASNGIFYVINQLLYPLPQDDIVSALHSRPDLTTISSFLEISGLTDMFSGDQPYTLFAPTDIAFSQLTESSMQELMQNTTRLREFLLGHIIQGAHYGREFLSAAVFPNLRGENLRLNTVSWGYQVNNVNIKTPEIVTGRGVIHMVDEVLISPRDARFIQKLSNTIDGVVPPSSLPERLINTQVGSTSSRHGSSVQGSSQQGPAQPSPGSAGGNWRSQTYSVSYGHATRTNAVSGMTGVVQLPPGSPQLIRHTTVFTVPGQQGTILSGAAPHSPGTVNNNLLVPSTQSRKPGSSLSSTRQQQGHFSGHSAPVVHSTVTNEHSPSIGGKSHSSTGSAAYSGVAQLANDIGLNRFASYITNSGLSERIEDGGTYTIFAPTDEALNALPPDIRQALDADPNQLRNLLQYHILPQKLTPNSLASDQTASTLLEGKKLRINVYNNGQVVTALGVPVDPTQDDASTISLIPVNQVLQPPSGNLLNIIEGSPYLTEFAKAIKQSHLSWMLTGESGVTLFAPSDAVMQTLTDEQRKQLIDNRRAFTELLKSHTVRGTLYSSGLQDGEQRNTENRKSLVFNFSDAGMEVNSIPVFESDIPATNGVLYIIDGIL